MLCMIPVGIPLFCSSKVPWELAGKLSAAKAAGSVSNLHVQCPPATPATHHHHKEEEKGAAPSKPGLFALLLDSKGRHRSCQHSHCSLPFPEPQLPSAAHPAPCWALGAKGKSRTQGLGVGRSGGRAAQGAALWAGDGQKGIIASEQGATPIQGSCQSQSALLDSPPIALPF